ncbi:hypothetical protein K501DRAFT_321443 [Backusella circina FSU 941]|nr:hypothetical protein K501DRAFT_321443 [Backusella circina FSU 941]
MPNHYEILTTRSLSAGSTFATHTPHTSAFNTVHIIAAVIGIIGACVVGITIFILCRRRRRRRNAKNESNRDIEKRHIQEVATLASTATINQRFDQFASDFERNNTPPPHIEQPKPAILHIEDTSPMMQQYRLQLKLLQQRQSPQQHRQHPSDASSSTVVSNTAPPPPYQP